ncbi:hypothetical protein ACIBCM_26780 [Streptomyces sp. NPDC051018]|uniref:hypothetical protein n=1 Tax=Streptomyces sp. NPDC051018 TaxID=3365639 RepID=UPI0037B37A6D
MFDQAAGNTIRLYAVEPDRLNRPARTVRLLMDALADETRHEGPGRTPAQERFTLTR